MLKNIKIGKKLIISFIVISILASISGIIGLTILVKLNRNYSNALVVNGFAQGDIGKFNTAINEGSALVRDMIFLTDKTDLENTQKELDKILGEANTAFTELKKNCDTPEELAQIKIIEENLPLYQQKRQEVITLGAANKNDEALEMFRTEANVYLEKCVGAAEQLVSINETMGYDVLDSLTIQANISIIIILIIIIASLIISILLGTYISRSISTPINLCSKRLELLANGDLHTPVPESNSQDEAGLMLKAMKITTQNMQHIIKDIDYSLDELAKGELNINTTVNYSGDFITIKNSIARIVDSLNDTLSEINQAAEQVSSGAEQVSSGSQELSQGTTEQASSIQELAATINEISSQVAENAQSSSEANEKATSVGNETIESNKRMQDMLNAMNDISSSSNEIGRIMKTIEDIAFQTNILALNAAVEAARAGSAGKGFAVVADEVRNLATKSQEASKNSAILIESSLKAVKNGTDIADQTAKSLSVVVDGVKEITHSIAKISSASTEQSQSIMQVTQGVDQISAVIQTNSATAEESAAASQELSGQSQMLKNLVMRFKLKPNTSASYKYNESNDSIEYSSTTNNKGYNNNNNSNTSFDKY